MKRLKILSILEAMPEESFLWFLSWIQNDIPPVFERGSRESIEKLKIACSEYMKKLEKKENQK